MLDRTQLETFAKVIEYGSFRRAADSLSITQSAVSQRIRALEEAVGTPLLMREAPVRPTHAGDGILRHIVALRLLEQDTLRCITRDRFPPAAYAIAVNADSLATWFESLAWALAKEHIALELVVDDQDHTLDALMRGDVMGCVSTNPESLVGFIAEPLGSMSYRCVCSQHLAARKFQAGLTVPAVTDIPAILFNRKDGLHDSFLRLYFGFEVRRYTKHYFPSPVALLAAIRQSLGYGLAPAMQVDDLIAGGELIDLAPTRSLPVKLYWHRWESEPGPAADVTKLVLMHARSSLEPIGRLA